MFDSKWQPGGVPLFDTLARLASLQMRVERLNYAKYLAGAEHYLRSQGVPTDELVALKQRLAEEMLTTKDYGLSLPPVPKRSASELKNIEVRSR